MIEFFLRFYKACPGNHVPYYLNVVSNIFDPVIMMDRRGRRGCKRRWFYKLFVEQRAERVAQLY